MSYYFNSIVEITLPITVFICLMLLLSPFVKKILVVKWRYYVWLFTALRLLMPFGVRILKPINISLPPEMTEVDFSVFSKGTENVNALSLGNIVFYVWLSFSVCFLIVNVVSYFSILRNIKRWRQRPSEKTISVAEKCEIKADKILICKKFLTPAVFGIIKPVIILPGEDYTKSELYMILKHESIHLKNKDVLYKAALLLALIVHWFNPVVWIMYKMGVRDLEVCCDKEVTKEKDSDFCAEYCHALISAVRKGKKQFIPCSTSFENSKQIIKERVISVFDRKCKRKGNFLLCCAFGFVIVCGGMIEYTSAKAIENTPVETVVREIKKTEKPQQETKPEKTFLPKSAKKTEPMNKKATKQPYKTAKAYEETEAIATITPETNDMDNVEIQNTKPPEKEQIAEISLSTTTTDKETVVYSIEENSLNIPISPDMDGEVIPLEFTGNPQSVLSVGCVDGECGYNIVNSDTGEICVDNSKGQNNKATVKLDDESSYSIQVFSKSEENASIYVYKE